MAEKRKRSEAAEGVKSKKAKAAKKRPEPNPLPEGIEVVDDAVTQPEEPSKESSKKKSSKKDNKSPKKPKTADETKAGAEAVNGANGEAEQSGTKKKTKKSKSKKSDKSEPNGDAPAEAEADSESKPDTTGEEDGDASSKPLSKRALKKARKESAAAGGEADENTTTATANGKAPRHIVFVGNLPFTANDSTIRQHFAAFKPTSVRCLTKDGVEGTCRGFAFVEFGNPAHMSTCLDKMHHTSFNDGVSPARKINVELTAGGGGSKPGRKEKIKQRNEKLAENRTKRIEKEKDGKKANATGEDQHTGMHPSRLAMIS
ncbi:hypothetical protein SODALDRAFT_331507 [Sodiomyces alkalinus F11]|uniref:RRM domain-containing protein n=1 Tax=Sodiomyces alkalinus (strain CBS 110278 / VKM F-3762 / F11) TaxID=1314773 RepID=A0A3N2Q4N5_SODAK|nr:hypothetical protein SODALDRAFT_331507 [Sodiomyces alkalinus F11]ROT41729.1 hypothetical protein SODALDRAFT_331507 [Sodiomyces alkalinus F11]